MEKYTRVISIAASQDVAIFEPDAPITAFAAVVYENGKAIKETLICLPNALVNKLSYSQLVEDHATLAQLFENFLDRYYNEKNTALLIDMSNAATLKGLFDIGCWNILDSGFGYNVIDISTCLKVTGHNDDAFSYLENHSLAVCTQELGYYNPINAARDAAECFFHLFN